MLVDGFERNPVPEFYVVTGYYYTNVDVTFYGPYTAYDIARRNYDALDTDDRWHDVKLIVCGNDRPRYALNL